MGSARGDPTHDPRAVRVAGIVLKWLRADKEANFRRAERLIREAAKGGARIVCTTECFLDGYAIKDKSIPIQDYRDLGETVPDGPYFRRLADLAEELNIYLIAGLLEAAGQHRYNTAVLLDPQGQLVGRYRKQELGHESVRNTPGKESGVFATAYGNAGLIICADRRYPGLVKKTCTSGADFLICPSGGMFGSKTNDPILQARSKENGIFIVFVHPAEFLVTAPDGTIRQRTILGDRLEIDHREIDSSNDSRRVFYFDLPVKRAPR